MRWLIFWFMAMLGVAQVKSVPLFTIEKSSNKNLVQYEAHLTPDGHFDPKQPVTAYWIMASENGRRQELNFIERSKAYGFTLKADGADSFRLWVVSHPEKEIHVFLDGTTVRAEAVIEGREALVEKIFVQQRANPLMIAFPAFAQMIGLDKRTGERIIEKVTRSGD
jgi:hypothetical protein